MHLVGHGTLRLHFETCCSNTKLGRLDTETYNEFVMSMIQTELMINTHDYISWKKCHDESG